MNEPQANRLRWFVSQTGLNKSAFARQAKLNYRSLMMWLAGDHAPTASSLTRIATAFELEPEKLVLFVRGGTYRRELERTLRARRAQTERRH